MFEWITGIVEQTGYLGVLALMCAENVFPPIPSELIMPLGGYVAASGRLDFALVVLAGSAGSLLGALPWYYAGRWFGPERLLRLATRHGRWLTLGEPDVLRAIRWFERHGGRAVFLGRLIPAVRTLISVPAGLARMPLLPFLAWSAAGTVLWTTALAAAGLWLEDRYELVGDHLDTVSKVIVGLLVLTYLFRRPSRRSVAPAARDPARAATRARGGARGQPSPRTRVRRGRARLAHRRAVRRLLARRICVRRALGDRMDRCRRMRSGCTPRRNGTRAARSVVRDSLAGAPR